ncbi:glycosyltransferase family 8 protein [Granulicatella sp. zg-ZJ]|uniref:glycosyltransferase family 8 protein n=1 Tax=Granulicatella sp. zg-ZJ TaxID=2678504 RepID=UPI0013D70F6D|nr:glycosyltransferase family 8 protein [Granulicatella sp. zg-ZJ]NEW62865.1 glycosyltransferase family 8 protein [Granulicatella sp. zg-ZJ]
MSYRAIVFAADNKYTDPLLTAIKSVCVYNQHIKFYILNDDIPKEWFLSVEKHLEPLNCTIQDVKLVDYTLSKFNGPYAHINYVTYFRYMIPEVVEEDRALYLDVDLIVTENLDELFAIDLEHYTIAAVKDWDQQRYTGHFNAGVLLLNLVRCREEKFMEKTIAYTKEHIGQLEVGDQTVLNTLYPDYFVLPQCYNYQIGAEWVGTVERESERQPIIFHYSTHHKPWNSVSYNGIRELWWFYHDLDWSDIKSHWKIKNVDTNTFTQYHQKNHCFILTNTQYIEHIEYLIRSLPNYRFSVAAHTMMSSTLLNLAQYKNAFICPLAIDAKIEDLLNRCSVYLDINHFNEVDNIVQRALHKGKPVITFQCTKHKEDDVYTHIISEHEPEKMVEVLKELEV